MGNWCKHCCEILESRYKAEIGENAGEDDDRELANEEIEQQI